MTPGVGALRVRIQGGDTVQARAVVVGTGKRPRIPECARSHLGSDVLHSSEFVTRSPDVGDRRVLVVGGGQSGAEIIDHLLALHQLPASVTWSTSRVGILPLDDSPFTNEWFSPSYVEHFHGLTAQRRQELLRHQRMASDGVSESLLSSIYERLYQLDVTEPGRLRHDVRPNRRLVDLRRRGGQLHATFLDCDLGRAVEHVADVVILARGFGRALPGYLSSMAPRLLDAGGDLVVRADYSLEWDGPPELHPYVQNAAEHTHGIADPDLSLSAWRSTRIINAIAGRAVYRVESDESTSRWVEQPAHRLDRQPAVSPTPKKVSS